ncbi:hypothetical protein HAX54_017821, partial [Datura stramonium]|nr:hypothetical protein [Datura stramonium]
MAKKRASSSSSQLKAPVRRGAGHGTTLVVVEAVQDAPSTVPVVVPTIALPTDVVMRLLNVLEALVPNHDGLP